MAYRQVYFRIRTDCYSSGWTSDADRTAFKEESRRLFQELGWAVTFGHNGSCDTAAKDQQDLYLHPSSFSGVIDEDSIQPLQEQLSKARTFRCYHVDRYEEYRDLSDEAYRVELDAKRDEITDYILEKCRTKRSNLYIVAPVALHVAEHFKIRRLCDKDKRNKIGNQFVAELMDQLLQKGWLAPACRTFTGWGRLFLPPPVHIGGYAWFVPQSLLVMVNSFLYAFQLYLLHNHAKGENRCQPQKISAHKSAWNCIKKSRRPERNRA